MICSNRYTHELISRSGEAVGIVEFFQSAFERRGGTRLELVEGGVLSESRLFFYMILGQSHKGTELATKGTQLENVVVVSNLSGT